MKFSSVMTTLTSHRIVFIGLEELAHSTKTGTAHTFFTPNNTKQVSDLTSELQEATQAASPKMLQLGEGTGSCRCRDRENMKHDHLYRHSEGKRVDLIPLETGKMMVETTPVCLRETWGLILNGVYSAGNYTSGSLGGDFVCAGIQTSFRTDNPTGFTRTVTRALSNMEATLQICTRYAPTCIRRSCYCSCYAYDCLSKANKIFSKDLEARVCKCLLFIIPFYIISSDKRVI